MHTQIHEKSLRNCKGCLPAHPKFTRTIVIAVHTRHCCANQKGSSEKQSRGSKASSSCRTTENSARKSKQHIFLPNTRAKRGSYRHIHPHVLPVHGRPPLKRRTPTLTYPDPCPHDMSPSLETYVRAIAQTTYTPT